MTGSSLSKRGRIAATIALLIGIGLAAPAAAAQQPGSAKAPKDSPAPPQTATPVETSVARGSELNDSNLAAAIQRIVTSGQVLQIGETSSSRLTPAFRLAPGAPPILAFRYLDGQARHRFGDLDLVMDDAGH
ncbi:MAG: hypothetical protein WD733_12450 [Bryobacterales bacterium]